MNNSQRMFRVLLVAMIVISFWHYSGLFHDHTRACSTGSMYLLTVSPEKVRVGEPVKIALSIAVTEEGPVIPFVMILESPDGSSSRSNVAVRINQGGFGEETTQYQTKAKGTYKVVVEKAADGLRVAEKEFAAYAEP